MLSKKNIISLAKRLAIASFDAVSGEISIDRVRSIEKIICSFPEQYVGLLMRKYIYFLDAENTKYTLFIEYCGDCSIDKIKQKFESIENKTFALKSIENENLIAGVRVSLGDFIWERSVKGDLDAMSC